MDRLARIFGPWPASTIPTAPKKEAPMDMTALRAELKRDEGVKAQAYQDSKGIWTVGVGHNLQTKPLSQAAIEQILSDDIADAVREAHALVPGLDTLDNVRQRVLVNMAFNLGQGTLSHFVKFLAAVHAQDWKTAATEMSTSAWAAQVGMRAVRLEAMIRTGVV